MQNFKSQFTSSFYPLHLLSFLTPTCFCCLCCSDFTTSQEMSISTENGPILVLVLDILSSLKLLRSHISPWSLGSDHKSIGKLSSHWFSVTEKGRLMNTMWHLKHLRLSCKCFMALHKPFYLPNLSLFICKIRWYSVIHSIFVMLSPELWLSSKILSLPHDFLFLRSFPRPHEGMSTLLSWLQILHCMYFPSLILSLDYLLHLSWV